MGNETEASDTTSALVFPDSYLPPIASLIEALRTSGYGVERIGYNHLENDVFALRWNIFDQAGVIFCSLYLYPTEPSNLTPTNVVYEVSTNDRHTIAGTFVNLNPDTPDLILSQLQSALSQVTEDFA